MDLSREFTQDEAKILQRELYRPGQAAKPAAKTPAPLPTRTIARPSIPSTPAAKPKPPKKEGPPSVWQARLKRVGKWLAILLLLLGLGAGSYYAFSPDPVEEIKQELAELREKGKNMSPEERRAAFKQIRQDMSQLTPKQRNDLGKERAVKDRERLDRFFQQPKEKQIADLKKRILEDEARRQRREAQRKANGANRNGANGRGAGQGGGRGGGGGGGGGGPGAGGRGGPGGGGPGGGFGGGPGGGFGGGRGGGGDSNTRQKNRLDSSTPEERAQRSLMRGMTLQLRQSMGLPAGGGRGGGR